MKAESKGGQGSNVGTQRCDEVEQRLVDAIEGELPPELEAHVAECDACRDRIHDAAAVVDRLAELSGGYAVPANLGALVTDAIAARPGVAAAPSGNEPERAGDPVTERPSEMASETRPDEASAAERVRDDAGASGASGASMRWLGTRRRRELGAALAMAAATAIGIVALRSKSPTSGVAQSSAPWRGSVDVVAGVGAGDGLTVVEPGKSAQPLRRGQIVPVGSRVRTDLRTRARIAMDDGSLVTLDRGTELALDASRDRSASLVRGSMVADVSEVAAGVSPAVIAVPGGSFTTAGAKLAASTDGRTRSGASRGTSSIAVARGKVTARAGGRGGDVSMSAGEGGAFAADEFRRADTAGLPTAFGWSELPDIRTDGAPEEGDRASIPGIGELVARAPGAKDTTEHALRLVRQRVSVNIAGELARTEIEETFSSDDARTLEGVFRFPLPPDAQIERLALDVDGKLEEGAFVDRDRGAAIWRGVIFNATPKAIVRRPEQEWVWVPGPWRDPALLEWRAGGRMELRIFPIPARGSRRVVLAYTQHVPRTAGARRYVYPLPHFASGRVAVEDFAMNVQVVGNDPARGVDVSGYEATSSDAPEVARREIRQKSFAPSGDVVVEFARKDEGAVATTYAYAAPGGGRPYFALSLAPRLPRIADDAARAEVIVVDASRSMTGERFKRASALAARLVEELDPRDRVGVLACDVTCVPATTSLVPPSRSAADRVRGFLGGVTPEGATDLARAVETAASFARASTGAGERALRVIYVGDGAPSVGPRTPSSLEAAVRAALPDGASLTAVPVGVDSDVTSLDALARGGGGVVVPFVAGETLGVAALSILEAAYGATLRDAELVLPPGLEEVAPKRLGSMRAGEEVLVTGRTSSPESSGTATLRGTVAGRPWSTSFPITLRASSDAGNAFVPRLFAATTVRDLERLPGDAEKARIVELSKTFAVPSRHTSLLVLESPAMAAAFGVERRAPVVTWSGEHVASATTTGATRADGYDGRGLAGDDVRDLGFDPGGGGFSTSSPMDKGAAGLGQLGGPAKPSTKPAPVGGEESKAPPPASRAKKAAEAPNPMFDERRAGGRWRRMRREWFRTVAFASDPRGYPLSAPELEARIGAARAASASSPDSRTKLVDLFALVAHREVLSEARELAAAWAIRDPLDVDGILRRGELTAREGDRDAALRIELGALDAAPDDVDLADGLAEVALRAGEARLSCAIRAARAELRPADVEGLVRRVECARAVGEERAASDLLSAMDSTRRAVVEARLGAGRRTVMSTPVTGGMGTSGSVLGDFAVDATWSSGVPSDLDVSIVDPKGVRFSWLSAKGVRVGDPTSTSHESIALPWAGAGTYLIEISRARPDAGDLTADGTATIRAVGQSRSFPFHLRGNRAVVARVDVAWSSRLVPDDSWGE